MAHHALVVCVSEWHEPCETPTPSAFWTGWLDGCTGCVCVMAKDHGCWCFTLLWHAGLVPPLSSCLPPLGVCVRG